MNRSLYILVSLVTIFGLLLTACQTPPPVTEAVPTAQPTTENVPAAAESVTAPTNTPAAAEPVEVPTNTPAAAEPAAASSADRESPMLAERVASGDLPQLEDRLPLVPLVVKDGTVSFEGSIPGFSLGKYGGTMRSTHIGGFNVPFFYVQVEPIVSGPEISLKGSYPNVVQDYQVSDDNTTFTFTLRKGLKWSDGEPVTMDDVKFVFEDLYFNKEYMPNLDPWLLSGDEALTPVVFEVIDDWNFRLTYATPKGALSLYMAVVGWNSWDLMIRPKHYLSKWHPKYADPAALEAELKSAGLSAVDWPRLLDQNTCVRWDYGAMAQRCLNYPGLGPYMMVEVTQEGATWERNPYYWKVDAAGRQLPYIDRWVSVFTADSQTAQTIAIGGEIDILSEIDLAKAALYVDQGQKLGFDLVTTTRFHADGLTFFFDGCTKDLVLRPLFNDIRFRKALNFAINRQEIIDNVYNGLAKAPDWIMPSEYSPEKANALFDEIGMTQRDAEGYRLSPDGQPVKVIIEYGIGWPVPGLQKVSELFIEHLKAVGLNAEIRTEDSAVATQRNVDAETDITVWNTFTPGDDIGRETVTPAINSAWCRAWDWRESDGTPKPEGMPDEFVDYLKAVRERTKYLPLSTEDQTYYEVIKKFYRDYYWALITVSDIRAPMWVNGRLGNITRENIQAGALRALEIAYWKEQ